jgi:hypothetical protein
LNKPKATLSAINVSGMKAVAFGLTLEELWQLFPIELTEHNPAWRDWYKAEESSLPNDSPYCKTICFQGVYTVSFDG